METGAGTYVAIGGRVRRVAVLRVVVFRVRIVQSRVRA
jgi:hypothetical protein